MSNMSLVLTKQLGQGTYLWPCLVFGNHVYSSISCRRFFFLLCSLLNLDCTTLILWNIEWPEDNMILYKTSADKLVSNIHYVQFHPFPLYFFLSSNIELASPDCFYRLIVFDACNRMVSIFCCLFPVHFLLKGQAKLRSKIEVRSFKSEYVGVHIIFFPIFYLPIPVQCTCTSVHIYMRRQQKNEGVDLEVITCYCNFQLWTVMSSFIKLSSTFTSNCINLIMN
jgi:hypothetical protein